MARTDQPVNPPRFMMLASICVVVAALYFAQDVLIPLALAVLLTFLLAPLVVRLERYRVGRVPSVIIVVIAALAVIVGIGYAVFVQLEELANDLPAYQTNITAKLQKVLPGRDSIMQKLEKTVNEVSNTATTEPASGAIAPFPGSRGNPLWVRFSEQALSPLRSLGGTLGKILSPLGTAGMVIVFTIFMLLVREDMRDRVIRLMGQGRLTVTTQALDDAATRISRYLLMQSIVNGTYGIAIATGLWVIGVPNPLLFGLLCALLRFIPYIGPWLGAALPVTVALGKFPGSREVIEMLVLFVVVELISNNAMEPWLYGSSTGISTVAVLVAAVFWTWLWGPVGLLLSTPLTVVLVVLGKYVPQLAFLDILLGDEPVLAPHERVYQRLLALDQEEATELVREYLSKNSLEEVYDSVLLPALALAEHDKHRDQLDERRHDFIRQAMRDMIDELGELERAETARRGAAHVEQAAKDGEQAQAAATPPAPPRVERASLPKGCEINVVCLPAHDDIDEIINMMLAQLLELRGYCALGISVTALASEMIDEVRRGKADVVVVSAMPPSAVAHARYLCKRLHARFPDTPMLVGLWSFRGDMRKAKDRIACAESVMIAAKLTDALAGIQQIVQPLLGKSDASESAGTASTSGAEIRD